MNLTCDVDARRGDFRLSVAFESHARAVGIVGPSGAGKTTLLQAVAGLIPVNRARIIVDGRVLADTMAGAVPPAHRRRVGYVFQDGRLFPHLSIAANVGFGRRYVDDPLSVEAALALVDLEGFEGRRPATLSGGEARRAAIARALLVRPRLLILDEPFTGLDGARRAALVPYLLRLRDELHTPMLVVSHDERDIAALCEDVVQLDGGRALRPSPASVP